MKLKHKPLLQFTDCKLHQFPVALGVNTHGYPTQIALTGPGGTYASVAWTDRGETVRWANVERRDDTVDALFNGTARLQGDVLNLIHRGVSWQATMWNNQDTIAHAMPDAAALVEGRQGHAVTLPPEHMAAIQRTMPFASTDETRYVLNSVLIRPDGFVATDGRRLHQELCTVHTEPTELQEFMYSLPLLSVMIAACGSGVGWFLRSFDTPTGGRREAARSFATGGVEVIVTKLAIQGNYPNWENVVPATGTMAVSAEGDAKAAADSLAPLAMMETAFYKNYRPKGKDKAKDRGACAEPRIIFSSTGDVTGQVNQAPGKPASNRIGLTGRRAFTASYNLHFLRDGIKAMSGKIRLLHDKTEPELCPLMIQNTVARHILMPLRLT